MQHAKRLRQTQKDVSWTYVQSVLVSIGNMTITWAGIELMLNNPIEWYQARVGNVIRSELPRNFSSKLDYVKAMESDLCWDHDDRVKLREIRLELSRLNEFRKNMVHGLLHQRNSRTTDWQVFVAREKGSILLRRTISYSNGDIVEGVKAISQVSHEMSPFFARIIGLPHPANRT